MTAVVTFPAPTPRGRASPRSSRQAWESALNARAATRERSTQDGSAPRTTSTRPGSGASCAVHGAVGAGSPRGSRHPQEASEWDIHTSVVQHLRLRGRKDMVWWHTPNEGERGASECAYLKALGMLPGVPDLLLVADGKLYALEIKTKHGHVSADQRAVMDALAAAGAATAVARGIDDAVGCLDRWGLLATPCRGAPRWRASE